MVGENFCLAEEKSQCATVMNKSTLINANQQKNTHVLNPVQWCDIQHGQGQGYSDGSFPLAFNQILQITETAVLVYFTPILECTEYHL